MEQKWSLTELYSSFSCNEIKADEKKINELVCEFKNWGMEKLCECEKSEVLIRMETYITKLNELYELSTKLSQYAHLTLSTDVNNQEARILNENIGALSTELTVVDAKFKVWINCFDNMEEIINSSQIIKEHSFFIKEKLRSGAHTLSQEEEIIIAKLKNSGSKIFESLQSKLVSNLMVEIEDQGEIKELPLNYVKNMEFSEDANKRKTSYDAQLKAYKKIDDSVAACLNGIKGEVITVSKLRGYTSPLHQTVEEARMEMETLDMMLEVIKENLPSFHKFYRKKAQMLGYKGGLPFYDIFAPLGNSSKIFTYKEAQEFVVGNFTSFSEELSDYAKHAFENDWIDLEPRQGKKGGAFCSTIHPIKQCRILCNYSGKFKSVVTLAHELGHGYHGKCLYDESYLNSKYSMPIAETASLFSETIVKTAALKAAKKAGQKEEYISILETDLTGASQVIVDIYSRFLFEKEVFERRENGTLSVEELKMIMIKAQKQAYGDALDPNYLQPYAWINKSHYYYTERNFYNFPYAFGILFSKGLYAQYLKEGPSFSKKYVKLLASTGKMSIKELAASVGIDINSKEFWQTSMNIIIEEINMFLEI